MRVRELVTKMHEMMRNGKTPKAQKGKHCSLCSLKELCHPNLTHELCSCPQ
ncbi:Dna2/Cas4 domain-containing protein [Ferroacidibacillus organovorans]|uniref:Dna2/Cas4 domain-containing protein n=1 Tax=Ferroacidibacillus organovorans TaxID=1765683 RepID=UPI003C304426